MTQNLQPAPSQADRDGAVPSLHVGRDGLATAPLFTMQDVFFRYSRKAPWVLSGASLSVWRGERIGIIGENGVGKSTIAKLLVGFFPADQGAVTLFGRSVSWQHHFPDLGYIGDPSYVEGEMALPNDLTVGHLLDVYSALFQASGRSLSDAESLRTGLCLQDARIRGSKVGNLSKGQRQRVLVYLALAKSPALLVADEATEGLDGKSRHLTLDEIKRVAAERHMTVIWITHRFDEIASLTESVYELREGKLIRHTGELFHCEVTLNGTVVETGAMPAAALVNHLGRLMLSASTVEVTVSAVRTQGGTPDEGQQ
jgi:ABC-type multidrug transport system ATPase subunit